LRSEVNALASIRVAFLNHVGSATGGAERTLATSLKHRPPDIEALAILFEDGVFADELRSLGVEVRIVAVPPSVMASTRETFGLAGALAVPKVATMVARLLRRNRVDVLYTNSMKGHVVGSLAGRLARVPCVMHFHDHIDGPGLRVLRTVAKIGSRQRISCSNSVSKQIGLGETTVIYSPVDLECFARLPRRDVARAALGIDIAVPVVAIVGRINRWKGHDRFIRIAAEITAQRLVQFIIVGSPIFRDAEFLVELEETVRELKLEHVVRFFPWVDDVRTVFAATDVMVNCSTREPLGRTAAEAAAAGIPSVVFDDSGAAEWMRETGEGRIVPAGDEHAFAAAIVDLLEESAISHARARPIERSAERFDSVRVAEDVAKVIRVVARR